MTRRIARYTGFLPLLMILPDLSRACASCYGAPDDPMTGAAKAAIFALLGVTGSVLGGFAAFIIHLARRSRAVLEKSRNVHTIHRNGSKQ